MVFYYYFSNTKTGMNRFGIFRPNAIRWRCQKNRTYTCITRFGRTHETSLIRSIVWKSKKKIKKRIKDTRFRSATSTPAVSPRVLGFISVCRRKYIPARADRDPLSICCIDCAHVSTHPYINRPESWLRSVDVQRSLRFASGILKSPTHVWRDTGPKGGRCARACVWTCVFRIEGLLLLSRGRKTIGYIWCRRTWATVYYESKTTVNDSRTVFFFFL